MKSMLLNGIIGDTYGAPIEMMPHECIMERYGLIKDYITTYKVKDSPYAYTDDSTMTIALIHFFLDNIQKHSKRKMETKEISLKGPKFPVSTYLHPLMMD